MQLRYPTSHPGEYSQLFFAWILMHDPGGS
jgi:hypothetical protein